MSRASVCCTYSKTTGRKMRRCRTPEALMSRAAHTATYKGTVLALDLRFLSATSSCSFASSQATWMAAGDLRNLDPVMSLQYIIRTSLSSRSQDPHTVIQQECLLHGMARSLAFCQGRQLIQKTFCRSSVHVYAEPESSGGVPTDFQQAGTQSLD